MRYLRDEDFIRGNIPMTKFDIRVLNTAYLSIEKDDVFLDIGGGTGSISIEAALQGAKVYVVEKEKEGIELINKNAEKFNAEVNIIQGEAPKCLPSLTINKCFIGGSGGKLEEIFEYLDKALLQKGIVCANFITLKNMNLFLSLLEKYKYEDIETTLIQSSKVNKIGMLKGNNPIFIIKGVKR